MIAPTTTPEVIHLSLADVARRWHCTPQHVNRLIFSGRLPAFNIGTSKKRARWVITLADVLAFERATRTPAS